MYGKKKLEKNMKHLGLFEGIGGFSLAARWMGWETVAWCEWNEFCQKILTKHFPESQGHGDITKTDFTIYRGRVDIITGGFPCQPYSVAGKRKGKDDSRHLWPEMLRAIREIQPVWVVGENVRGLVNWDGGMVFDEVQSDLEAEGFKVIPFLLPACAVNAPHKRERIWFLAYSDSFIRRRGELHGNSYDGEREVLQNIKEHGAKVWSETSTRSAIYSNTNVPRLQEKGAELKTAGLEQHGELDGNVTDPNRIIGCKGGVYSSESEKTKRHSCSFDTRNDRGAWENFPTQSPVCGRNDGISYRVDRIKALGNAIVPQVALQIFKAIEAYEKNI